MQLTDAQLRFIQLEKQKAEYKKFLEELDAATEAVVAEIGFDAYFQDPSDGTVYKTVKPQGTFVSFREYGYERTRRAYLGEVKGLSMKEVESKGFELGPNQKDVVKTDS